MLTDRQSKILYSLIQEHIKTAEPVASSVLAEKCKFNFSPATVRNEFAELEEMGFLDQPYTSAGRVPTDKAYRYFVDGLLGGIQKERQRLDEIERAIKSFIDSEHFNRHIVKSLANASNNLALGWVESDEDDDFHFAGLKNLLKAPEFENNEYSLRVGDILDRIDDEIEMFMKKEKDEGNEVNPVKKRFSNGVKVYIGSEMPIRGAKDFSLIISSIPSRWGDLRIAILGPTRMDYEKNLRLLKSVKEMLE